MDRNIEIQQKHRFSENKLIIIGNRVDNIIHGVINHNLILTTNVNSIFIIEEHNKLLPEMIIIGGKWENMAICIVEYLHSTEE